MAVFINDRHVCSSDAIYGARGESSSKSEMGGHSHAGGKGMGAAAEANIKTISAMTSCTGPIPVKKGDTMRLVAQYDLSKHPLRETATGGKASDVMGMMALAFAADK
jgi:hypothetical protein